MLAGTPVHVYVVAVVVIAADAIVHTHAAVVTVPLVPSLKLPATSSFAAGAVIPIPILHNGNHTDQLSQVPNIRLPILS